MGGLKQQKFSPLLNVTFSLKLKRKKTQKFILSDLRARSRKNPAGSCSLQGLQGTIHSVPLPSPGGCWHSLTCDHSTPISISVVTLPPPLLAVTFASASHLSGHLLVDSLIIQDDLFIPRFFS